MLHLFSVLWSRRAISFLAVLGALIGGPAGAQPTQPKANAAFKSLVTDAERVEWSARTKPQQVTIRRIKPLPPGFRTPDGHRTRTRIGSGLVVGPARVLTAFALTDAWPVSEADRLEVVVGETVYPAAVGLSEGALGLAVLDVPGLAGAALEAPADHALRFSGRWLYGRSPNGVPAPVVIGGPGLGQKAYYFEADCAYGSVGMPVFDANGRFSTLVGLPLEAAGRCHVLPPKAIAALWARRSEWL